jgi:glycosyltransferase involved in cell wall biosynthesis
VGGHDIGKRDGPGVAAEELEVAREAGVVLDGVVGEHGQAPGGPPEEQGLQGAARQQAVDGGSSAGSPVILGPSVDRRCDVDPVAPTAARQPPAHVTTSRPGRHPSRDGGGAGASAPTEGDGAASIVYSRDEESPRRVIRAERQAGGTTVSSILQVITGTDRRGAEVFGFELGRALSARDHDVRTLALNPGQGDARLPVDVVGRRRLGPATLRRLRDEARKAQVVVAHGSNTLPACALALAGTGIPFVYRNIGDPRYWSSAPSRRLRVAFFLRRAQGVVVLWPGAAEALVTDYGIRADRIRVIPNAVPAECFPLVSTTTRAASRRRWGLEEATSVVAYIGALSPEKDVAAAVQAMGRVPGARLLVAGDGPQRHALEALAQAVAPQRVRFVGSTQEPALVLAAADVLVLPSRTEGIPAVAIEAGLSGLPVVASAVGGVGEVVDDGRTGFLVPPGDTAALGDALRAALSAPRELGARARRRCLERFDMGTVADEWSTMLRELTGEDAPVRTARRRRG